jgi:predicted RNA binding protein YcfA (HicA-like mRNA interferase family)
MDHYNGSHRQFVETHPMVQTHPLHNQRQRFKLASRIDIVIGSD